MKLLSRIDVFLLLFVLNITDLAIFGGRMLLFERNDKLENFSRLMYWLSLTTSQFMFTLFNNIDAAIAAPLTESSRISRLIIKHAHSLDSDTYFTNGLISISLGTMIYGILSLFFMRFCTHFRKIPKVFYHGIFVWLGILQFQGAYALIKYKLHYIYIFIISFILYVIQFVTDNRHISFVFAFVLCVAINIIQSIYEIPREYLIEKGIYAPEIKIFDGFTYFKEEFSLNKIDLRVIWCLKYKIILLAFFSLLNILLNLFTFEGHTNNYYKIKGEFFLHGLTNMIGFIFLYPTCFVCSYSTILHESKMANKNDKRLLLLCYFLMVFIINKFFQLIPLYIQAIFPIIVGFSIFHGAYHDMKEIKLKFKLLAFAVTLFFCIFTF